MEESFDTSTQSAARPPEKQALHDFWNDASCGEALLLESPDVEGYRRQASERYRLEPYIPGFARFEQTSGKDVLEIGVGLGADHQGFAAAGARLTGVDLTSRAIEHTRERLRLFGLQSSLAVGDAENLVFPDNSFDMVYSWGVIHHSPDTPRAAREILRVLRPGGRFAVMIYQRYSLIGAMLWLRYALGTGRPWMSLDTIYSRYLESPGTKAYTKAQAAALFAGASDLRIWSVLTHGDLLESGAGQRHSGMALGLARKLWPRRLLKRMFPNAGLFLMIEGHKPLATAST
ncbi:class I SAM-dependent methyltransferase [Sphingomonas sp. DG1-23]|uniref:class I SAM-dependent methyltransferase n=1 Tax=Sphingomonas sp. DG1-23 TaxID=3068316 RepID=UPI0027400C1F|nr:class I SAM-dependent methyltransferase [Sphingomonas sp. DG1-23]MDP5280686.1 class I SAM-dependent methyltransferase [Sphingomonas sp. DG1-23]